MEQGGEDGQAGSRRPSLSKPHCFWKQDSRSSTMRAREEYEHMAMHMMRSRTLFLSQWSHGRAFFHSILESKFYSILIAIIIVLNSVVVIHETDQKAAGKELPPFMKVASNVFLGIYGLELLLRFFVHRIAFFTSGWNTLDLVIVLADIFSEVIKVWAGSDVPSVSILRIFRLARLLRVIAMFTVFQELQTMLLGFVSVLKGVLWASLMLGVVLTLCSIIAVEFIHPLNVEVEKTGAYGDCHRCGRAFETVAESNLTFIQQIIAGDSWGRITIPIIEGHPGAGIFFLLVFGFIDLGVLNLILTVIVNAAEQARESNHEMQLRIKASKAEDLKKQLKRLVSELDFDHDGRISLEEFMIGVDENEELRKTLALLDFQRQDAEIIYFLMDEDQSGDVDYHEFIHAMITWKNESANTKLLFLKASIHDIYRDLKRESRILNEEVIGKMLSGKDIAQIVSNTISDPCAQTLLPPDNIKAELESLALKLDQRWEQLQIQLTKRSEKLDHVTSEEVLLQPALQRPLASTEASQIPPGASQIPEVERGSARKSALTCLALPPSCSNCQVKDSNKPRMVPINLPYALAENAEPGERIEGIATARNDISTADLRER